MPTLILPLFTNLGLTAIALSLGPKFIKDLYDVGTHIFDDIRERRRKHE